MNQTIILQGHAPAVRASRALRAIDVRKMCARAISLARRKSVTLAVISAVLCYIGVLLGQDPLTYTAAFAALGAVGIANAPVSDNSRCRRPAKGGEL